MDRLYVRGRNNVHKKLLIQAAACNLALLMRTLYGAGNPKAAHDRRRELVFAILRLYLALANQQIRLHPGSSQMSRLSARRGNLFFYGLSGSEPNSERYVKHRRPSDDKHFGACRAALKSSIG
jgi:hypothetical protein